MDGLVIYTPVFSGSFWDVHDYVMEDIDRIEVVRGPGASIWGANAMNGVINIITKSASQTQGTYLSQTVGNGDHSITEARYGGKLSSNLDSYRFYAKHAVRGGSLSPTDGTRNNDGITQDHAGFRYDLSSMGDSSLAMRGDFFDGVAKNYFSNLSNAEGGNKKSNGGNVNINWNKALSKKSSLTLQTYFDYNKFDTPILTIHEKTFDLDLQHFYNSSDENQFIWGLGYKNTQDSIAVNPVNKSNDPYYPIRYNPNTRNIEIYSAFIQDKIGLVPNKLYLTLGSKFEINDLTGFEYQPNARLSYYPSRDQTLWAAVSRAVRTPTRGEDNIEIKAGPNIIANQGSNIYKAEDVIAYEVGYRIKPSKQSSIDVATFYNNYNNLRTFENINGSPTASNKGYGETYGFEINGKWQVFDAWRLEASYDLLKVKLHLNKDSNESLTAFNADPLERSEGYSPKNQFRIRSLLNLTTKIEFDNMLFYVDSLSKSGSAYHTDPATGVTSYGTGIKPYTRWDTRIGYLVSHNLDISLGVQNILKSQHQEFQKGLFSNTTQVGRTYYIKAVLQF